MHDYGSFRPHLLSSEGESHLKKGGNAIDATVADSAIAGGEHPEAW